MNSREQHSAYTKAKARVQREKGFYSHLIVYIIVNVILLFLRNDVIDYFTMENKSLDFKNWFDWNILITPFLWGIGLLFHGLSVFGKGTGFNKAWEERKIKEYMDRDDF